MPRNQAAPRSEIRQGLTLVELLVVMAVVGTLVGLLLPAVNAAREAGRRSSCQNNLRQLGIAFQQYHGSHGTFPVGCIEWRPFGDRSQRQLAWGAFLLPFLEEVAVYERLDLSTPFDSPQNAEAAAVILPVFLCPSVSRAVEQIDGRGPCHYGGIFGERIMGPNRPPKGTMLIDSPISIAEIRDGTSRTLLVSEDSEFADGQWINGRNLFDQAFAINAAPAFENDIRSDHPGGANGLFADGSVHFLAESLELPVLAALCTRAANDGLSRP